MGAGTVPVTLGEEHRAVLAAPEAQWTHSVSPPLELTLARRPGRSRSSMFENPQSDAELTELGAEGDQVQHRATQAIQPGDHQMVAARHHLQLDIEFGSGGLRPTGDIEVDILGCDTGPAERVDLVGGILLCGGHPPIADQHVSTIRLAPGVYRVGPTSCARR